MPRRLLRLLMGAAFLGLVPAARAGIEVGADQRVAIDFTLQAGNVTETITVEGAAPLVNRVSSEVGEVLRQAEAEADDEQRRVEAFIDSLEARRADLRERLQRGK